MNSLSEAIDAFLAQHRIAVVGVSRESRQPANGIYRKLRSAGYSVLAVNQNALELEGDPCYPDLAAIPGSVGAVVAVTPLAATADVTRQCIELGIKHLWMHEGTGPSSVSIKAVAEAESNGINVIAGACPMMFVPPVDPFHRCLLGWKRVRGRLPEPTASITATR